MLFGVLLLSGGGLFAQEDAATDVSTDEGITAIPNSPEDSDALQTDIATGVDMNAAAGTAAEGVEGDVQADGGTGTDAEEEKLEEAEDAPEGYDELQTDLKKDRLTDALKRIQVLEQENRFQTRRIEKLERDVNDLRNNNSSRASI